MNSTILSRIIINKNTKIARKTEAGQKAQLHYSEFVSTSQRSG